MAFLIGRKDKRIIIFVSEISGIRSAVGKKKVKPHEDSVKYRGRTFPFDINNPIIRRKNKFIYYVDIRTGQCQISKQDVPINPKLFDLLISHEIIAQIVGAMKKRMKFEEIVILILGIGLGIAVGYIIGNYVPMTPS